MIAGYVLVFGGVCGVLGAVVGFVIGYTLARAKYRDSQGVM